MQEYTLYTLNPSGVVDTAHRSRFASERLALDHARSLAANNVVEVWNGRNKVARVFPSIGEPRAVHAR